MKRFILSAAILATMAASSQAAGRCGGFRPIRNAVSAVKSKFTQRPVAAVVTQTAQGVKSAVESKPVRTFVGGCVNGVCQPR